MEISMGHNLKTTLRYGENPLGHALLIETDNRDQVGHGSVQFSHLHGGVPFPGAHKGDKLHTVHQKEREGSRIGHDSDPDGSVRY